MVIKGTTHTHTHTHHNSQPACPARLQSWMDGQMGTGGCHGHCAGSDGAPASSSVCQLGVPSPPALRNPFCHPGREQSPSPAQQGRSPDLHPAEGTAHTVVLFSLTKDVSNCPDPFLALSATLSFPSSSWEALQGQGCCLGTENGGFVCL